MAFAADMPFCWDMGVAQSVLSQAHMPKWGEALSGAIGGPLLVGILTPQRNAMTLAAKDVHSTYSGLYRLVFRNGFAQGFMGGSRPTLAAVPQFTAIGPVFLAAERHTASPVCSMLAASLVESLFTYSAQRRNAQIQYNATRASAAERLPHQPLSRLVGPGFISHVGRNMFAMAGIRLISPHSYEMVRSAPGGSKLGEETAHVVADLVSSIGAATISMPFNHVFSWAACTPELEAMSYVERAKASMKFLVGNYQEQGWRLLSRDLCIRASYTGLLFTMYHAVERKMVGS